MSTLDDFKAEWEQTLAEIGQDMEAAIEAEAAEAEADDVPGEEADAEEVEDGCD